MALKLKVGEGAGAFDPEYQDRCSEGVIGRASESDTLLQRMLDRWLRPIFNLRTDRRAGVDAVNCSFTTMTGHWDDSSRVAMSGVRLTVLDGSTTRSVCSRPCGRIVFEPQTFGSTGRGRTAHDDARVGRAG